jgi:hypothetical protein
MIKQHNASRPSSVPDEGPSTGPNWVAQWVPLQAITKLADLQVRHRLDPAAIKRYGDMTRNGSTPPPIKVARTPSGALFLVDGWHRLEAGALETRPSFEVHGDEVWAEVAELSEAQARWEAARANLGHGVPLKTREMRNVFQAFVKAGQHKQGPRGALMSYREMSKHIAGVSHTTLRNWTAADFTSLFHAMGGAEQGNDQAQQPQLAPLSFAEQQALQAIQAAKEARAGLHQLTPPGRRDLFAVWQAAIEEAKAKGLTVAPLDAMVF